VDRGRADALSTAILLTTRDDGRRALGIRAMYDGSAAAAERLLRPLFEAAGAPLEEGMRSVPYAGAAMGGTPPRHVELFDELSDAAIEAVTAADAPTVEVRHWGGAIAARAPGMGPTGARATRLSVIADAHLPGLAPHATGGAFLNFLSDRPGRRRRSRPPTCGVSGRSSGPTTRRTCCGWATRFSSARTRGRARAAARSRRPPSADGR
jgi:hypothetical protein